MCGFTDGYKILTSEISKVIHGTADSKYTITSRRAQEWVLAVFLLSHVSSCASSLMSYALANTRRSGRAALSVRLGGLSQRVDLDRFSIITRQGHWRLSVLDQHSGTKEHSLGMTKI